MEIDFSQGALFAGALTFPEFPFATPGDEGPPIKEGPRAVGGNTGTSIRLGGTVSAINQPPEQ